METRLLAALVVQEKRTIRQASRIPTEAIKDMEKLTTDESIPEGKRIFTSSQLLMAHASLRFSDAQALISLRVDRDTITGVLGPIKNNRSNNSHFACPRRGFENDKWILPLARWRDAYCEATKKHPKFTVPDTKPSWEYPTFGTAAPYPNARQRFTEILTDIGVANAKQFTMHSHRAVYPTLGALAGFPRENLCPLGRWRPGSNMPNVYNREAKNAEVNLRNRIIDKVREGKSDGRVLPGPDPIVNASQDFPPTVIGEEPAPKKHPKDQTATKSRPSTNGPKTTPLPTPRNGPTPPRPSHPEKKPDTPSEEPPSKEKTDSSSSTSSGTKTSTSNSVE